MFLSVKGLVLREVRYKEADKILTVLTHDQGKVTVTAHGALGRKSLLTACAQAMVYSEMVLQETHTGRWTLKEARPLEMFQGLRSDLELLALGQYFCEVAESVADADSSDASLMSLVLNSLWTLSRLDPADPATPHAARRVKATFELRLLCLAGFEPDLEGEATPAFSPSSLSPSAFRAAQYVVAASPKKIFSYDLPEEDLRIFGTACEMFLMQSLDRSFASLDYYKKL